MDSARRPDEGTAMLAALKGVRGVFESTAQLLRTADASLGANGWTPLLGSRALSDLSASLDRAHDWMPFEASRFYEVDDRTVAFVAVLLGQDPRHHALVQPLTEPLCYGGWVRYEEPRTGRFGDTWLARMWHWMEVENYRTVEGVEVGVRSVRDERSDGVIVEQGCVAPVGLVTLRSAGDVEERVLETLRRVMTRRPA